MDDSVIDMPTGITNTDTCRKIWLKDGNCDSVNNNAGCGYDSGDCCRETCLKNCDSQSSNGTVCMFACGQQNRYNCTEPSAQCSLCKRGKCNNMGQCLTDLSSIMNMIESCGYEPWSQGNYSTTSYFCGKSGLADPSTAEKFVGLNFALDQCTIRACCDEILLNKITRNTCDNTTRGTYKVIDPVTQIQTEVTDITCINFVSTCFLANMRYRGQCCECEKGWAGYDCATPICSPRCLHGTCIDYNKCSCDNTKWTGDLCDIPICQNGCIHGVCTEPNHCECYYGYTGSLCEQRIFYISSIQKP